MGYQPRPEKRHPLLSRPLNPKLQIVVSKGTEPEQNPPQSVSGVFTWEEAQAYERAHPIRPRVAILEHLQIAETSPINMEESRKATYQRVWTDLVNWGYTVQEADDALIRAFASGGVTIAPEPIGDSSDGIAPCGYEEL